MVSPALPFACFHKVNIPFIDQRSKGITKVTNFSFLRNILIEFRDKNLDSIYLTCIQGSL